MNMINLDDLTIVIPYMWDHEDRVENLEVVLTNIFSNFIGVDVIVVDQSIQYDTLNCLRNKFNFRIIRVGNNLSFFYKTKLINESVSYINTKFFLMHDVDAFLTYSMIMYSYNLIKLGYHLVYPHCGRVAFVGRHYIPALLRDCDYVNLDFNKFTLTNSTDVHCGLAFLCSVDNFINMGMMNEKFKVCGEEDWDLYYRAKKLGYIVKFGFGIALHLEHYVDKRMKGGSLREKNKLELERTKDMSVDEILHYIRCVKCP